MNNLRVILLVTGIRDGKRFLQLTTTWQTPFVPSVGMNMKFTSPVENDNITLQVSNVTVYPCKPGVRSVQDMESPQNVEIMVTLEGERELDDRDRRERFRTTDAETLGMPQWKETVID